MDNRIKEAIEKCDLEIKEYSKLKDRHNGGVDFWLTAGKIDAFKEIRQYLLSLQSSSVVKDFNWKKMYYELETKYKKVLLEQNEMLRQNLQSSSSLQSEELKEKSPVDGTPYVNLNPVQSSSVKDEDKKDYSDIALEYWNKESDEFKDISEFSDYLAGFFKGVEWQKQS